MSARIRLCRAAAQSLFLLSLQFFSYYNYYEAPVSDVIHQKPAAPQRPLTCHARSCSLGGKKHSCLGESIAFLCDSIVSSSKRAASAASLAFTPATWLRRMAVLIVWRSSDHRV